MLRPYRLFAKLIGAASCALALDSKAMKAVLRLFPTYTYVGDAGARGSAMTPGDQLVEFISGPLGE
jgi:hypothetical protein